MTVDEILAPFYCKVFYVAITGHEHQSRIFFDTVPSYNVGGAVFDTYTDAGHLTGWSLHDIIAEIDTRLQGSVTQYAGYTINRVERYESASGANIFKGFDPADYSDIEGGAAGNIASATYRWVFQGDLREPYSIGWIDMGDAKPQRTPLPQPPVTDDGFLPWFMLRSAVKFVTVDGVRLTRAVSSNTGYNRYAARKYGKAIAP